MFSTSSPLLMNDWIASLTILFWWMSKSPHIYVRRFFLVFVIKSNGWSWNLIWWKISLLLLAILNCMHCHFETSKTKSCTSVWQVCSLIFAHLTLSWIVSIVLRCWRWSDSPSSSFQTNNTSSYWYEYVRRSGVLANGYQHYCTAFVFVWKIRSTGVQPIHRWTDFSYSLLFPPSNDIYLFNFDPINSECCLFLWLFTSTRWSSRVSLNILGEVSSNDRSIVTMMTFLLILETTSTIEIVLIDFIFSDWLHPSSHHSTNSLNDQSRTIEVIPQALRSMELCRWYSIVWSVVKSSDTVTKIYLLYW